MARSVSLSFSSHQTLEGHTQGLRLHHLQELPFVAAGNQSSASALGTSCLAGRARAGLLTSSPAGLGAQLPWLRGGDGGPPVPMRERTSLDIGKACCGAGGSLTVILPAVIPEQTQDLSGFSEQVTPHSGWTFSEPEGGL